MSFAERLQRAWYHGHPVLRLLSPIEAIYRRVVTIRRKRFLDGTAPSYRAPVPVIVVGNITVGGTGKTPLILWLIEHCRSRMAHYKCPTSIELRGALDRTATGKLQKFKLREPYWAGRTRRVN